MSLPITFVDLATWPNLDADRTSEVKDYFWNRWRPALQVHGLTRQSFGMMLSPPVVRGDLEFVDVVVGDIVSGCMTDMTTRVYADLSEQFQYCGTDPWLLCCHAFPQDVDME